MITEKSVPWDADRRRRAWWVGGALLALLLGTGVGCHLFYDIPDPDPADYAYEFKTPLTRENVFVVFERDTKPLREAMREDWTKRLSENDQLSGFETGCEDTLRMHVEAHRDLGEKFRQLVREAERPLAYPEVNAEATLFAPLKVLTSIQDGASAWLRTIQLNALSGDILGASGQALEATEFAKELSQCDSTLLHWLVMMTGQAGSLKGLENALKRGELPKEVCLEYRRRLQAAELARMDFAKCIKMEMWLQARTWERLRGTRGWAQRKAVWMGVNGSSHWFLTMTFKPNMTIVENGRLVGLTAQGLRESWVSGMAAAQKSAAFSSGAG